MNRVLQAQRAREDDEDVPRASPPAAEAVECQGEARHERREQRDEVLRVGRFGQVRADCAADHHQVEQEPVVAAAAVERRRSEADHNDAFPAKAQQSGYSVQGLKHVRAPDRVPPLGGGQQAVGKHVEAKLRGGDRGKDKAGEETDDRPRSERNNGFQSERPPPQQHEQERTGCGDGGADLRRDGESEQQSSER